jgi:hypothetical protein
MRFCFTSKVKPCDTRGVSLTDKGTREQSVAFRGVVSGSRGGIFQQSKKQVVQIARKDGRGQEACVTL